MELKFWKKKMSSSPYLRSAFVISLTTYLLLILADIIRPGFVSNYFSAHWLLLVVFVLFVVLVIRAETWKWNASWYWVLVLFASLGVSIVTWKLGRPLEELRILLTIVLFFTPIAIYKSLITHDE